MVNLKACSMEQMLERLNGRKLVCFGAGKHFVKVLEVCPALKQRISAIIDNSPSCAGKQIQGYPVYSLEEFMQYEWREFVVMITSSLKWKEMLEQLDQVPYFNGVDCYLDIWNSKKQEIEEFHFMKGVPKIPKKIHYCWVGGNPIPRNLQQCIDSWKKFCPDYEIIRWDENNYDFTKNKYMCQAYECKKWGFVPDYARLDIVHTHGGIYLDTDVELIRCLDDLRVYDFYCGFETKDRVALGLGFGAVSGHPLLEKMMESYEAIDFVSEGKLNLLASPAYQSAVIARNGFELNGRYQEKNGVGVLPYNVLAPGGEMGFPDEIMEKTYSIHHYEASWVENRDEIKQRYIEMMELYKERVMG